MFQSMMLCGRQIIDLYQKHAITIMEYKWDAVKDDAEVGFEIDDFSQSETRVQRTSSLIGCECNKGDINLKTI